MGINALQVTRFPDGVTNAELDNIFSSMTQPDPTKFHQYFEDFDYYVAADWTITTTETGAGDASEALADEDGGVLLITNDDADDDADFFNKVGESFLLETGKKLFFKARLKVSDATESDFVVGLQITDTTPLDVSDGVFFQKDDGNTELDFHVEKDGTATSETDVHTVEDDTYIVVGFYWDGQDRVYYSVDDTVMGYVSADNLPDDEELTISFGIQNGEAAAKTMSVDYVFAAKER